MLPRSMPPMAVRPCGLRRPIPFCWLFVLCLLTLLALFCSGSRSAQAQTPPLTTPVTATVYLPQVSQFQITQPLAAGAYHTCAILPGGVVRCWGSGDWGQLGNGTWRSSARPVTVQGLPPAHAVAAGADVTCTAAGDGVYCWGRGYDATPVRVEGVPPATQLAMWWGWEYGNETRKCALGADGSVTCWWSGETPTRIEGISGATAFAPGLLPCVLVIGGALQCWEMQQYSTQMPDGLYTWPGVNGANAAAAYSLDSYGLPLPIVCVADAARDAACWRMECDYRGICNTPAAPDQPQPWAAGAQSLAATNRTLCALRDDGRVVCGGDPLDGEGGLDTSEGSGAVIPGIENATAVAVGINHACAMHSGGQVSCWGSNARGQLGSAAALTRSDVPLAVPVGAVRTMAAIANATCSVDEAGTVACWGAGVDEYSGALPGRYVPQSIVLPAAATQVSLDRKTACALMPGTGIACWPLDWQGTPSLIPQTQDAKAVAVGHSIACHLGSAGGVYCWWSNPRIVKQVQGLPKARSLAVGSRDGSYGCAVTQAQTVACWKRGPTADVNTLSAVAIPNLAGVTQVAMTATGACALHSNGHVSCWDFRDGYWEPLNPSAPTAVAGLDHITAIAISDRSCALREDGQVLRWWSTGMPAEELRVPGATALAIGGAHTCVVAGGQLLCQGDNSRGQLARNPGWTPVQVEGLQP